MKIKSKSSELLKILRNMARITAASSNKNYRLIADDVLWIGAASSELMAKAMIPNVEVVEKGELALPMTVLPILAGVHHEKTVTLKSDGSDIYRLSYDKSNFKLTLESNEPQYISMVEENPIWSGYDYARIKDITYAAGKQQALNCVFFVNGGAVCSDGVRTSFYQPAYPLDFEGACAVDHISYCNMDNVDIYYNGQYFLGTDLYFIVVPRYETNIPRPLKVLQNIDVSQVNFTEVDRKELESSLDISKRLGVKDNQYFAITTIEKKGDELKITPIGNHLGSGNSVLAAFDGEDFTFHCNSVPLLEAVKKCKTPIARIATHKLFNIEIILLNDGEVTHSLVPINI